MRYCLYILLLLLYPGFVQAQKVTKNIPYVESGAERQQLDIYAPEKGEKLPVVFWIHGGGWMYGSKEEVEHKPKAMVEHGYVFVSTNYRLLQQVNMETLIGDVAKSLVWVKKNISQYGGDPERVFVMGHSAGAQLAAIMCTDESYLKAEGVTTDFIAGCVPVDGDTYDIPAMITVAELRARVHEFPPIKNGHREKFGNDPLKHINFSAITHIKKEKKIAPFLIMYVNGHPDTTAQASRLFNVLNANGKSARLAGAKDTDHSKLNDRLGLKDDPQTQELWKFMEECLKK